jgi:hypothetical protein
VSFFTWQKSFGYDFLSLSCLWIDCRDGFALVTSHGLARTGITTESKVTNESANSDRQHNPAIVRHKK